MQITTKAQVKALVSALRRELKLVDKDVSTLTHTNSLELLAKTFGFKSWNEWEASLSDVGNKAEKEDSSVSNVATTDVVDTWSPTQGPMPVARYIRTSGIHCPVCGQSDLYGESIDVDAGYCEQEVSCNHCNSSWTDYYTLSSYEFQRGTIVEAATTVERVSYAFQLWMLDGNDELTEDRQEALDEIIVDLVLKKSLNEINSHENESDQDSSISAAEKRASAVNNMGVKGQLDLLLSFYKSTFTGYTELATILSNQLKLDLKKLVL